MKSQGQGGRFNFGQPFFPQLKKTKKRAMFRRRKNYGTRGAEKPPRRYPLYDILEELDTTTPAYTVVSEPEEPMMPVEGVPLIERYPWAGELKTPEAKQYMEDPSNEDRLEPYFGSITGANLPPLSREQKYVHRYGWPHYNYPPWLNRPKIGEGVQIPGDTPWKKDRTPAFEHLSKMKQAAILKAQAEAEGEALEEGGEAEELED